MPIVTNADTDARAYALLQKVIAKWDSVTLTRVEGVYHLAVTSRNASGSTGRMWRGKDLTRVIAAAHLDTRPGLVD